MVMVKESHTCHQVSAWNSPGLDHLPLLQLDQCIPPFTCTANVALPEYPVSILPGSNAGHQDAVDAFLKLPPLNCDLPHGTGNLYSKDSQCALLNRLGVTANLSDATCAQKRFLIFDQSGNKTRLFFSSSSHHNQIVASKIPACANGSHEKPATQVDKHISVNPIEEKWDENQLTDGEDEMLEDSEEIDAFLYSDSEEEYEDDGGGGDGENDEVTSMGHTPYITEVVHRKHKLFEKLEEEVTSSDDLPKRQKLLDGGFKQPSLLVDAESPVKLDSSYGYEDDVESSNAGMRNCYDDIYSSKREKKKKVRVALKILESIIPGVKSKDPLFIIDKAITHLNLMKLEAKSLGLGHSNPNGKLTSFP